MHELSIAIRIVEIARESTGEAVASVRVRVGARSGVVPEALRFAWGPATAGTPLAGSTLEIDETPAAVWCETCGRERELPPDSPALCCPDCDTPAASLTRGRELEILSLEIHDDASAAADP